MRSLKPQHRCTSCHCLTRVPSFENNSNRTPLYWGMGWITTPAHICGHATTRYVSRGVLLFCRMHSYFLCFYRYWFMTGSTVVVSRDIMTFIANEMSDRSYTYLTQTIWSRSLLLLCYHSIFAGTSHAKQLKTWDWVYGCSSLKTQQKLKSTLTRQTQCTRYTGMKQFKNGRCLCGKAALYKSDILTSKAITARCHRRPDLT